MALLRYGMDSSFEIPCEADALFECRAPEGSPPADLAAAVGEALAAPLDFPPLAQATTPADRVVVALEPGLPCAAELVAAVVDSLLAAPVDPDGITVLQDPADARAGVADPRRLIPQAFRERVALATHDPHDRNKLAYLAADDAGSPILLNRALHEADLVLPIGCLHSESTAGCFGLHGILFPGFSDRETQKRFRSPAALGSDDTARQKLVEQSDRAAWLLGVQMTLQVLPGPGDSVLRVLAGQSETVAWQGSVLYHEAWDYRPAQPADLVVAAIRGGPGQQTWENVGRALDAALNAVDNDGAIAVCCSLADNPGPALQQLAAAGSRQAALQQIEKEQPPDALVGASLARARDRASVYLLSGLDPEVVDQLDMIHVAEADELVRLAGHYPSCLLLADAPRAVVSCQPE